MSIEELVEKNSSGRQYQLIDVRSPSEFNAGHIPRANNIPLEQVVNRAADLLREPPLVLICQSGHRAQIAGEQLEQWFPDLLVLTGGTGAWKKAGHPVIRSSASTWSLERQVRFGAGLLILLSLFLVRVASWHWLFLTAFVGVGLTFAGVTDICGMGMILSAMPWNRNSRIR